MSNRHLAALFLFTLTVAAQEKPVVAVLDFKNTTGKFFLDDMQRSFPALLKTELSQQNALIIVERQKIEDLLKEQDFVLSDLSEDKDKQAKVGDLLGADFLITGDLSEAEGSIRVDVAITKISSGQVMGEKVVGPSKASANVMARLLANNIVFQLTGAGTRQQSIRLKGKPTTAAMLTTAVLATGSLIAWRNAQKYRDEYRQTTNLFKMQERYDRANGWHKAAPAITAAAGVSAVTWLYMFIKNRSTNLEVLADHGKRSGTNFAIQPMLDEEGRHGLQISVPIR